LVILSIDEYNLNRDKIPTITSYKKPCITFSNLEYEYYIGIKNVMNSTKWFATFNDFDEQNESL